MTEAELDYLLNTLTFILKHDAKASGIDIDMQVAPPAHDWPLSRMVEVFTDGVNSGQEFSLVDLDCDDLVLHVVDFLQDVLSEYSTDLWPRCPGHTHGMTPVVDDGILLWCCETSDAIRIRAGDLPEIDAGVAKEGDDERYRDYWDRREHE